MVVKGSKTVELAHRAFFIGSTPDGSIVLAASTEGNVSIINADGKVVEKLKTKPLADIGLHPEGKAFAVVERDSGSLQLKNLKGSLLAEIRAPELLPGSSRSVSRAFENCFFSESGKSLLATAHIADDVVAVQHFDLCSENGLKPALTNTLQVEDAFVGSSCSFYFADKNLFPLWIAAGQDGQRICWFTIEQQRLKQVEMASPVDTAPPVFSPDGEFFAVGGDDSVCIWSLPLAKQIGCCAASDEEDAFAHSMCFVSEKHLIVATQSNRVFAIDASAQRVIDELVIAGHEPRPTSFYYPPLKDDELCTDISFFRPAGHGVVFVHRRDKGTGLARWCDSLTFVDNKSIVESLALPKN